MEEDAIARPVAVDLFCGAGGMSVGFEQAGFDVLLAVDRDAYHVATHHRNFPYGQSIMASVTEVTAEYIRSHLPSGAEVALIYGGPPCQGFSTMGLRDVGDPRNSLVDHFARIISDVRPRAFVMENVPGMNTGDTTAIFDHAVNRFRDAGYRLAWPVQVLNAADFGVPQLRSRLFVLGVREDCAQGIRYPAGPPAGQPARPDVIGAIGDLPDVDAVESLFREDCATHEREPESGATYARVARGLAVDPSDFSRPRIWDRSRVTGCQRVKHGAKARDLYRATPQGRMVPGHKLPKLDPGGLAPTLRAGTDSARGSHTAPRPVHPSRPRVITVREAARLHGYPDWFAFYPTKWHAYRQIGNSVCPPVAKAVGGEVLRALGIDPTMLRRPAVELGDEFLLSEDRPKHQRRIPVAREFPKVINHLWIEAGTLTGQSPEATPITASRIASAIAATGAELPRVRADRFLLEVARYRGLKRLLSIPRSAGYTILITDASAGEGRWVQTGTVGAMGESDQLEVKSSEINDAVPVGYASGFDSEPALLGLLESSSMLGALGADDWSAVRLERELFSLPPEGPYRGIATAKDGQQIKVSVVASANGKLPTTAKLWEVARGDGSEVVFLLAALTRRHALVAAFDAEERVCSERWRSVVRSSEKSVPPAQAEA